MSQVGQHTLVSPMTDDDRQTTSYGNSRTLQWNYVDSQLTGVGV